MKKSALDLICCAIPADTQTVQLVIVKPTENDDDLKRVPFYQIQKQIIGYYDESYKIDPNKINLEIGELIRSKLINLIEEIKKCDLDRPDFKINSTTSDGIDELLNFGQLVKDLPKETNEHKKTRSLIKELVEVHNKNLKKGRTFDIEIEYFISVCNKIDELINKNQYRDYLQFLIFCGKWKYSEIFAASKNKRDIITKIVNHLVNTKNISSLFSVVDNFQYEWLRYGFEVEIVSISKLIGNLKFKYEERKTEDIED